MWLENIITVALIIEILALKSQTPTESLISTYDLCYSPCVVQVPDLPPHRWRPPPNLARAEVYCHLKAVCRLNQQTLHHHRHCLPEEEDRQRH